MKKLLLIASTAFLGLTSLTAQTSMQLTNNSTGDPITNGSVFLEDVTVGNQSHVYIQLKNISSSSVTYAVKKTEVTLNPGADAYFCWGGQCFPASTTITPVANYVTLTAGQTYAPQSFYYDENNTTGFSEIQYQIYDVNNTSDAINFTFKFNPTLASVKDNNNILSSVSDVYPNPSANKAQIKVASKINTNRASVSITNALGSLVSVKNIDLITGENNIQLDSESLNSGIYFATITSGNNKIVKKFVVNK